MGLIIREATLCDIKDILSLVCYLSSVNTTLQEAEETFTKFFKSELFIQFVAEKDEKIIGIIGVIFMPGFRDHKKLIGYLQRLVVHPDYRKKGVGSMLLEHAINYCRKKCYKIILHSKNEKAIRIYEKNGFKKHSVLMELSL